MTDNDPAVTIAKAAANGATFGGPAPVDLIVAALRTPEGARALFPELAAAVDAWTEHVTDSEHLNVGRVAMIAARVFTLPDQPDQENPE
jgi:hypothetical protein